MQLIWDRWLLPLDWSRDRFGDLVDADEDNEGRRLLVAATEDEATVFLCSPSGPWCRIPLPFQTSAIWDRREARAKARVATQPLPEHHVLVHGVSAEDEATFAAWADARRRASRRHGLRARLAGHDSVLVFHGAVDVEGEVNGWIIDSNGNVISRLTLGASISDLCCVADRIVVGYSDQGVFNGMQRPAEGVAVLDRDSRLLWGWNSQVAGSDRDREIIACYAMASTAGGEILVVGHPGVDLAVLSPSGQRIEQIPIPEGLDHADAIAAAETGVCFWHEREARLSYWEAGSEARILADGESLARATFVRGIGRSALLRLGPEDVATIRISVG